nr:MAG TPA: helix-turn-helix domain protein [Caudoviricetes sp.]
MMEGLKAARLSKGMTQLELARKLGVVRETISLWESGTNRINSEMLVRISEVLECSIDFLCKKTL